MKRLISLGVAIALCTSVIKPVKANPAVLAPVAFCAGTAGVGCVLVGTALVGGTIYYVWRLSNGRKVKADAQGRVFKSEYLEDPEEEMQRIGSNATQGRIISARNATEAFNKCAKLAGKRKTSQPLDLKNGRFQCRYH